MGKSGSKSFVNQFKNTRRQAGREQRKIVKGSPRPRKKHFPGESKSSKNPGHGSR
jgi:hypothetical protein